MTKIWNSILIDIQVENLHDLRIAMTKMFKPPKFKHFSRGSKTGNMLLTRIRVGRSDLNQHRLSIGLP